jgi:WD40 repeat protein
MARFLVAAALLTGFAGNALAQTADAVTATLAKFKEERAEAVKLGEPADRMTAADQFAEKANAALKAEKLPLAAKLAREARWALPARPLGLPENVERVIGYVRLRHADRVNAMTYTPDGEKLISASRDGTVRVWDLGNGREVFTYRGHVTPPGDDKATVDDRSIFKVPAVAVSADGTLVASTGSGEIHVWDLKTGKLKKKIPGHNQLLIRGLAFLPDGKHLATGGDDKIVRVWTIETAKEAVAFPAQNARIEAVAVSPNGKLVAATDANGLLAVYKADGSDKKPVMAVQASDANAANLGVLFTSDGAKIFTAGGDQKPRLTTGPGPDGGSAAGMATTALRFEGHAGRIHAVAATKDGKLFATASDDKTVRVWDSATGKTVRHFQGLLGPATAVAVRPDGKQLAAGTDDGTIRLWDLSATDEHRASTEATDSVWTAAFGQDGTKYATGGADRTVRVYETATGKLEHKLTGHAGAVTSLTFLPGGRLASAGGDKVVKLWDAKGGKFLRDLTGHGSAVLAVAADGPTVVSGGIDKAVKGWDVEAGKAAWTWPGRSAVAALAVRKGGKQVAVGTADGWLTILNVTASEAKPVGTGQQAHVAGVAAIAYSADGGKLATVGGDGKFALWSVSDDGTLSQLNKDDTTKRPTATGVTAALSAVAFGPDGKLAASAGADMAIHVWDTATGAEVRTLRGHTDWVTAVAFAPDGEHILSVGVDKVARVFELSKAEASARIGHAMAAKAVAVRKDGKLIASGSDDKTIKIWELATGKEVATLAGSTEVVFAVCFVGLEKVASGGDDSRLRVWSVAGAKQDKSQSTGKIYVLQPSADGTRVGVWSRGTKDVYEIVPLGDGKAPEPITEKERTPSCATFSADLSWVVSGADDGTLRIWDTAKRESVGGDLPIHVKRVADVGLTADKAKLVAVDEDGVARVVDTAKREVLQTIKTGVAGVMGVMVVPTGDKFAVIGAEGEVKAFDLAGKELRAWAMPTAVNGVAFTPDGKKLISANADGTLAVLVLP